MAASESKLATSTLDPIKLGRCTHFIDPTTPEDQLEALTAELTEKDPEVERLRSITEDKLPEGNPLGLENVWQARVFGNTQVFQKEEAAVVYGVVAFRNVLWPGWVSIGYVAIGLIRKEDFAITT